MNVLNSKTTLVDTAIGPVAVTIETVDGVDIDDYVHEMCLAAGRDLQLKNIALKADQRFTSNRIPVSITGTKIGGY